VLWEIAETARRGLDYLYLGYWITESPKMSYKINYQPVEALQDGRWSRMAAPR
jgi:arginine-tRNA-protein transferase